MISEDLKKLIESLQQAEIDARQSEDKTCHVVADRIHKVVNTIQADLFAIKMEERRKLKQAA